jgi:glycosyltransferase involved in cell wall biosynthesis
VLAAAAATLRAVPAGRTVVIDGLALGGMPDVALREAGRVRLVALVHHPLALESGLDAAAREALYLAERRAVAAVSRVIVTSPSTARALADYGLDPAAVAVVEPGTEPAPLAPCRGEAPMRLLCVASLTPRKGHGCLLDALAGLRDRPWRLDCIGSAGLDPATADAVARQVRVQGLGGRVVLHGEVDDAALDLAYAAADAFVLASFHEGYGMAFAEALARGLPVIGTTAGAVPDTVPAAAGLLVPPGDPQALRDALRRLLDEPGLHGRLRDGARAARAGLPTWDRAVARFAAALPAPVTA